MPDRGGIACGALALAAWSIASFVAAPARAERADWMLDVDVLGVLPLAKPQSNLFGLGGSASLALHVPLASWVDVGLRARGTFLTPKDEADDPAAVRPKLGSIFSAMPALRIGVPTRGAAYALASGPSLELAGGAALTGDIVRAAFEAGANWNFAWGALAFGPTVRYLQVIQPSGGLDARDARLAMAGFAFAYVHRSQSTTARTSSVRRGPPQPPDADGDGVQDARDSCPDDPEDYDSFQDGDGCPEADNDGDKIADVDDTCRNDAEDFDGFEDEDGCPELDNDGDGFADAKDSCPNEREVINGINDGDGCPDTGLIEMVGDRIVLEERVLFDFSRTRVKRSATPVLRAVVNLWKQHSDWTAVRVEGHADRRGNEELNKELSTRRAANVRKALIRLGIPENIIESVGFGSEHLLEEGTTEAVHQRNRRVEFVVIGHPQSKSPDAQPQPQATPSKPAESQRGAHAE